LSNIEQFAAGLWASLRIPEWRPNMISRSKDKRWHDVVTEASQEQDEEKLFLLVEQLCSAFDERHTPPAAQMDREDSDRRPIRLP
jgi:hypothetical protein